jgi:hypothetical protein
MQVVHSKKFERCKIWAMFIAGPPFVMSRTHAQNGLYSIINDCSYFSDDVTVLTSYKNYVTFTALGM